MSSTTGLPRIVWDRATPRERDRFLNLLCKALGDFPQIKVDQVTTDGAGTWLTCFTSNKYPKNSFAKIIVEADGIQVGEAGQYADLEWRDTFIVDSTSTPSLAGGLYVMYSRSDPGYQIQTVNNGDRTFSVQVKDRGTAKMSWTLIVKVLELSA